MLFISLNPELFGDNELSWIIFNTSDQVETLSRRIIHLCTWCFIVNPLAHHWLLIYFSGTGVWIWGLALAKQVLYPLSHAPSPTPLVSFCRNPCKEFPTLENYAHQQHKPMEMTCYMFHLEKLSSSQLSRCSLWVVYGSCYVCSSKRIKKAKGKKY
jgi:hypothetical protein